MTTTDKTASDGESEGFTAEERAAMRERAKENRTAARRGSRADTATATAEVLAKIAELPDSDRVLAERVHAVIIAAAPTLSPRLWYGMPGYAKDGRVLCFFQSASKFKTRYATLGFNDVAALDEGDMWPTVFALQTLTAANEARITALVQKAVG
ncbi:MAG: hypothetical protein B5766_07255 [Candidatus Lumbricidophila eiseniae]|uniref:Uncharacterized protein n=1 Tax=Candidatus Lumbricidiphila eiseniae TaxID=1969409 RepID=A0A2A6FQS1_9MICO|nr:MAG: hypothetical protein B5766_07255 [Candidatus Lumbricidophila eiseniae]